MPPERPLDSAWVGEEPEIVPEQQPETAEPATLVTLGDLYTQLAERLVETEQPYDVEAGLDRLNKWIDGQQQ
ncbi:MAG TPA: hypothetical protein VLF71_02670 [Candidatus Saccharimonadales bacterium]|nr:hypothetical protein [Candidatus Saccharimonadales bacterium]